MTSLADIKSIAHASKLNFHLSSCELLYECCEDASVQKKYCLSVQAFSEIHQCQCKIAAAGAIR